ncbi:POTRA domain-containing protein, ShlB-type [Burkholderia sp. GAS332]|nr:POTRA domain-containing protein, ShlB-type [Burkholderia sp. GAS332]
MRGQRRTRQLTKGPQQTILSRGYIATRVLLPEQDLSIGVLGFTPMIGQHDGGGDSATTNSGIGAGPIMITDQANQQQDVASLNRDTADLKGTVASTPDVAKLLSNQADVMNAASAAAQAIAKDIGTYASNKEAVALKAADQAVLDRNLELAAQYRQEAANWSEGGDYRVAMHVAAGGPIGGLGGGSGLTAVGGAVGAGLSAGLAGKMNELAREIAGSEPTGNAAIDKALGDIVANAIVTGLDAAAGENAGASMASTVDLYNRQLHPEEKSLAKQFADKSGGQYSEAQIEDQMRQMGVSGQVEAGTAATLIGQTPTHSGASWISGGTTADGKPILAQLSTPNNLQL